MKLTNEELLILIYAMENLIESDYNLEWSAQDMRILHIKLADQRNDQTKPSQHKPTTNSPARGKEFRMEDNKRLNRAHAEGYANGRNNADKTRTLYNLLTTERGKGYDRGYAAGVLEAKVKNSPLDKIEQARLRGYAEGYDDGHGSSEIQTIIIEFQETGYDEGFKTGFEDAELDERHKNESL